MRAASVLLALGSGDVDMSLPINSVLYVTGVVAWVALVASGLWFAVAGAYYQIKTILESRRTVQQLFGEDRIPSTPFGYRTALDVDPDQALPTHSDPGPHFPIRELVP